MRIVGSLVLALLLPLSVSAVELININTASTTALMTLPGVGAVIAGRIVDYRTTNGLFITVQDIQKVSGIGSGSTYAKIAPLITVGDTTSVSNTNNTGTASTTIADSTTQSSSSDMSSTSVESPSTLSIDAGVNKDATMEVPLRLSARVTMKGGGGNASAHIEWGFGDGSSAEGRVVEKTYHYAGTYLVVVTAADGGMVARDEFVVTVRPAQMRVLGVADTGIMITNETSERLDLSGWSLFVSPNYFRIPNGTIILPKASVLFAADITKLLTTGEIALLYPGGSVASRYIPTRPTDTKPLISQTSFNTQAVEPPVMSSTAFTTGSKVESNISSTETNIQTYAEAVRAPTTTTELAAVGAALPVTDTKKTEGLLRSPWILSLLGVIVLAGSAFIFL